MPDTCTCRCRSNGGTGGGNCCTIVGQLEDSPAKAYGALMRIAKNFAVATHHEFENYFSVASAWAKLLPTAEQCRITPRLAAIKQTIANRAGGLGYEVALLGKTIRNLAKAYRRSQKAALNF